MEEDSFQRVVEMLHFLFAQVRDGENRSKLHENGWKKFNASFCDEGIRRS